MSYVDKIKKYGVEYDIHDARADYNNLVDTVNQAINDGDIQGGNNIISADGILYDNNIGEWKSSITESQFQFLKAADGFYIGDSEKTYYIKTYERDTGIGFTYPEGPDCYSVDIYLDGDYYTVEHHYYNIPTSNSISDRFLSKNNPVAVGYLNINYNNTSKNTIYGSANVAVGSGNNISNNSGNVAIGSRNSILQSNSCIAFGLLNDINRASYSMAQGEGCKIYNGINNAFAQGYYTSAYSTGSHSEGKGYISRTVDKSNASNTSFYTSDQVYRAVVYSGTSNIYPIYEYNWDTKNSKWLVNTPYMSSPSSWTGNWISGLASGMYSHSEGENCIAIGNGAHAEGLETLAEGDYSHSEGYWTTAVCAYQHVFGRYNIPDQYWTTYGYKKADNYIEIVGNGNANEKDIVYSNARALDWDGNEYLKGKLYFDCYFSGGDKPNIKKEAAAKGEPLSYSSATWKDLNSTEQSEKQCQYPFEGPGIYTIELCDNEQNGRVYTTTLIVPINYLDTCFKTFYSTPIIANNTGCLRLYPVIDGNSITSMYLTWANIEFPFEISKIRIIKIATLPQTIL